jgi:hypothetical protein
MPRTQLNFHTRNVAVVASRETMVDHNVVAVCVTGFTNSAYAQQHKLGLSLYLSPYNTRLLQGVYEETNVELLPSQLFTNEEALQYDLIVVVSAHDKVLPQLYPCTLKRTIVYQRVREYLAPTVARHVYTVVPPSPVEVLSTLIGTVHARLLHEQESRRRSSSTVAVKDSTIPKRLHMVWLAASTATTSEVPPAYMSNIADWTAVHPDYRVQVWLNLDIENLILDHEATLPITLAEFQALSPHICKCDVARLLVTFIEGGFYVDLDFIALSHLDTLPRQHTDYVIINEEHDVIAPGKTFNGFFGFAPAHRINEHLIRTCLSNNQHNKDVMTSTGPVAWTVALRAYDSIHSLTHRARVTNSGTATLIIPLTNTGKLAQAFEGTQRPICFTLWGEGTSWGTAVSGQKHALPEDGSHRRLLQDRLTAVHPPSEPRTPLVWVSLLILATVSLTFFLWLVNNKQKHHHHRVTPVQKTTPFPLTRTESVVSESK